MRKLFLTGVAALALAGLTTSAFAGGTLKGKFVFDGKAPAPDKLMITKDANVCAPGGKAPVDESLVVGEDGGIANIVVGIYVKPGGKKPPVDAAAKKAIEKPVVLDNTMCRFEPRVTVLHVGQDLILKNSDSVGHNVKADLTANPPFNDLLPANGELKRVLKSAERLPMNVSCSIHPWMRGYLLVRDDPYAAVSKADGSFEIPNLPAGKWTFRVWHELSGYVEDVKVDGKSTSWKRGQVDIDIKDGATVDLGEIKVGAKEFERK